MHAVSAWKSVKFAVKMTIQPKIQFLAVRSLSTSRMCIQPMFISKIRGRSQTYLLVQFAQFASFPYVGFEVKVFFNTLHGKLWNSLPFDCYCGVSGRSLGKFYMNKFFLFCHQSRSFYPLDWNVCCLLQLLDGGFVVVTCWKDGCITNKVALLLMGRSDVC